MASSRQLRVTVWNEDVNERRDESVRRIYPDGIHGAIADGLHRELGASAVVHFATLEEPEHGLTAAALAETDVLTWWGHAAHDEVADEVVDRVHARVLDGMGIVVLHSAHYSKIFRRLMGTSCALRWRSDPGGEREVIWTINPGHPIAAGVPQPIVIPHQEMYGEFFDIPPPRRGRVHKLVRGRRGFSQRLLFQPRGGTRRLFRPRRPGVSRLPPA